MRCESGTETPTWVGELVSALDEKMGLVLTEVSAERVCGSMPVAGNTQPYGLWHGGASGVLIETLASVCAVAIGYPERVGVGVDLNVTHLRPATTGRVYGVARPLRVGRQSVTVQVELTNDDHLIGVGRLTCQLVKRP